MYFWYGRLNSLVMKDAASACGLNMTEFNTLKNLVFRDLRSEDGVLSGNNSDIGISIALNPLQKAASKAANEAGPSVMVPLPDNSSEINKWGRGRITSAVNPSKGKQPEYVIPSQLDISKSFDVFYTDSEGNPLPKPKSPGAELHDVGLD